MDNRPNENDLVNNHIPKFGFFKTNLDPVMSLSLLTLIRVNFQTVPKKRVNFQKPFMSALLNFGLINLKD
jgi:hypothetical protein